MSSCDKYTYIYIDDSAKIVLGAMPPLDELESQVSCAEIEEVAAFKSEKRRRERLAWRAMLRHVLALPTSVEHVVEYDVLGAPHLINSELHIGVSHSSSHVAVIISDRRCAVDIEPLDRNCAKAKSRFISSSEEQFLAEDVELCRAWCAKEALYKFAGVDGLSLLGDIEIKESHPDYFIASLRGVASPIRVNTQICEGLVVAYIA